jgi:hypothetical protein
MNLDAYMDDFGRELKRARPPRQHRRLLIAAPTALALTAVGVIALPRGDGIDAIAEARQALAPGNDIVHMVIEYKPPAGDKKAPRIVMPKMEQWYAAAPNRWRTRTEFSGNAVRRFPASEQIFANGSIRIYDQRKDVVNIYRGVRMVTPAGVAGPGFAGGDPATELRKQLDAGDVRDDGVVEHDGKPVRRLVREQKIGLRMQQRFVFYMDPQTFAPLGGRMYFTLNRKRRFMSEFTISTYERIPLTDESKQLLHFDKTPSTKYVWHDIRKPRGKVKPAVRVG